MMTVRIRKLIGAVALLALVITWALLAMGVAQLMPIWGRPLAELVFYMLAGLGWVLPAMPLISWMSRPDAAPR